MNGPSPTGARPSGVEHNELFSWVIGIFGALVVTTWAGAALAAAVTGHAGRVAFTDAGGALVKLIAHPAEPKGAWPPRTRSSLPGPFVYWAAQLVVVASAVSAGVAAWWCRQRLGDRRGAFGVTRDAGLARARHLRRLIVRAPEAGRVTLGWCNRRLLACEPQASLAVIGPSGCGKTAGFAIPALLEWRGPIIATSVKGDLLAATLKHRQRRGKVWIYDPTGCSAEDPAPWSVIDACRTWQGALRTAAWMVEAVQPARDSVADADYWYSQARKGVAPYLYAAGCAGVGIGQVVRWVDSQERAAVEKVLVAAASSNAESLAVDAAHEADHEGRWNELHDATVAMFRRMLATGDGPLAAMVDAPFDEWPLELVEQIHNTVEAEWQADRAVLAGDPDAPLVSGRALWSKEPRLRGSVFATMENVLSAWADPSIGYTAQPSPFRIDLDEWSSGDNTIYVVATAHEQTRLRPVLTVLLQQTIRHAYDTAARQGGRLETPCLVLIDEAGNTVTLPDLPGYASTARSHGITLVTVWQDIGQLKASYRARAQTVLNNHRAKLFGTGISDPDTLEFVSRLIGDEAQIERNVSTDLTGGRRTLSEHSTYRRAAPIDVVRRLGVDEAALLYGSELPAHVRLRPWFRTKALRATADRDDLIDNLGRSRARHRR
ncbi:MAG TPA: type IV secretory system conjugative DNA transfer family protein [Acidimicrobiales bacterium]|nr:type IV secretory system conjugative DNA transfer family protein [Acidimicrobiales bacterium]